MAKSYQILLIEDEEKDIKLIEAELNKVNLDTRLQVISTKQELSTQLNASPPHLIICDYGLANISGMDILNYVQEKKPNLPFIFVSESIGEDKAVDAMLQGASDYVMKDDLCRLRPALIREITNYEEYQAQRSTLEKTQTRYESLIQSVNGIVWESDADTFEFQYVSPKSLEILGYTPDEWLNTPNFWEAHIHPDDRKKAITFCHDQTQQGNDHSFEYRMFNADDEIVWIRDYVSVIYKDGSPNQLRGLMVDISKEKQTEFQRDKAYEIAGIGHWELDLIREKLFWSNAVKSLHEVDQDFKPDLESALSFYKEGVHLQKITDALGKAIESGEPFDIECKITTANDNDRWVRAVGEPEFRDNKCIRIFGSTQDITSRKKVEQKLRDIVEYSTNMFYRHDTNHVLSYVSPQAKEFLGYAPEEAKQKWTEFATDHPINEKGFEHTQKAIDTGRTQPAFELQLQKKNGEIIWVLVNEAPIVENGETTAIIGALTDITEQKKYEKKLRETNKKLKKAQDIAKLGYWKLDLQTDSIYWSEQAYKIWGISEDQPIDMDVILEHMHPDDRDTFIEENQKALDNKQPLNVQHRIVLPDGSYKWVEAMGSFKFGDDGTVVSFEGTVQDITERKKVHERLKQLNQELEERANQLAAANKELEQFAYVASHDLQEPLRMVSSFLKRLEKKYASQLDDKAQQYIDFAVDGAQRMRRIILDLLNYSRIDQNNYKKEEVNLNELIDEIKKLEHTLLQEEDATIHCDDLPTIKAARTPIQQVFQNLLNNALKYTAEDTTPEIQITSEQQNNHWKFSISDNGIGIKKEFQDKVFTLFQRLHTQQEYAGTGIGLAVSQKIIEKHGGEIWVDSKEGEGSTFHFTIAK